LKFQTANLQNIFDVPLKKSHSLFFEFFEKKYRKWTIFLQKWTNRKKRKCKNVGFGRIITKSGRVLLHFHPILLRRQKKV